MIVSAHGNSLRALEKHLSNIGDDDIVGLEIPTGQPIVYELADDLSVERPLLSQRGSRGQAALRPVHRLVGAIHDRFGACRARRSCRRRSPRAVAGLALEQNSQARDLVGQAGRRFLRRSLVGMLSSRMANSSPPIRATMSLWRTPWQPVSRPGSALRRRRVPEGVVDRLEAVDVDEQHRRPNPVTVDSGR